MTTWHYFPFYYVFISVYSYKVYVTLAAQVLLSRDPFAHVKALGALSSIVMTE